MVVVELGQVDLEGGLRELLTQLFQLLLQLDLEHPQAQLHLLHIQLWLFNLICRGRHLNLYILSDCRRRFRAARPPYQLFVAQVTSHQWAH